jgi:hypothetical protein
MQRGLYLSPSRVRGDVSYLTILGSAPITDEPDFRLRVLPFRNRFSDDQKEAELAARRAVRAIFGPGRYEVMQRSLMQDGTTLPVKVSFKKNGRASRDVLYVKKPDTNRLVGKYFYDIISGIPSSGYAFNRDVFLEEGVHGSLLSDIPEDAPFLHSKTYGLGLARAAAHADFLGLFHDVTAPRNRIVDSRLRTVLFDFNLLFRPCDEERGLELLDNSLEEPWYDKEVVETFLEEQYLIGKRVEEHHKPFFRLARIAGELTDFSYRSIDQRISSYYGARNLEEYFENRLEEYHALAPPQ